MTRTVVHVIHDLRSGGTEHRMLTLLDGLDRRRFRPLLCCVDAGGELLGEARALGLEPVVLGRRRRRDPSGILRLARLVRAERADIVHGWLYLANLFGRLGGRLGGAPVVVASEGSTVAAANRRKARVVGTANRVLARVTDAVVANSEAVAEMLRDAGVPAGKITIIHNGVARPHAPTPEQRERLRASVGAHDGEKVVGMVARLDPVKDHETLLRAFGAVAARRADVRLALVGDGPARPALERLSRDLALDGRVTFTGYRPDAVELPAVFDVALQLSYSEGFSNAVLESMAWGRPTVVSDVPANREALGSEAAGVVVPVGDADATAAAIEALIDDPDRARALGEAARARAAAFSLEAQAEQTMELYERLLAQKNPV